jgi:hypothetical protein
MWQMLKASAQILDRIWSHQNRAKIWEGTKWYASPPAGLLLHLDACSSVWKSYATCALFLSANQQPQDCEILINNLLQLVRLHEKFTEDGIHAHLPARGWRASFFKWKDTRAMGFWLP